MPPPASTVTPKTVSDFLMGLKGLYMMDVVDNIGVTMAVEGAAYFVLGDKLITIWPTERATPSQWNHGEWRHDGDAITFAASQHRESTK